MGAVDSRGAEQKAQRAMSALHKKIEELMPQIAEELALSALSRAPSVDEEYNALMAESGGVAAVPRAGDRSADSDGRVRLQKPVSSYMENAVINPANRASTPTTASIGNLAFLEAQSVYTYINLRRTGKHEHEPSEPHVVGPYFDALENGGSEVVQPVFVLANGHTYRLRPVDDDSDPGTDSMTKSFPGAFMFAQAALEAVATETITTALSTLGPGRF